MRTRNVICCGWYDNFVSFKSLLLCFLLSPKFCLSRSRNWNKRVNLCLDIEEDFHGILQLFIYIVHTKCWGYNENTKHKNSIAARILERCCVLCCVQFWMSVEYDCAAHNEDYNELQKLDKVAAGNGLNKWILCNLCHFSVVKTSSDEYWRWPHKVSVSRFLWNIIRENEDEQTKLLSF